MCVNSYTIDDVWSSSETHQILVYNGNTVNHVNCVDQSMNIEVTLRCCDQVINIQNNAFYQGICI